MTLSSSDERTSSKKFRTRPRQQPGHACEECRSRKLGCDRRQPKCGTCENLGIECTQNRTHKPRGPKRGYISALQSRITALESRLGDNPESDIQCVLDDSKPQLQHDDPTERRPEPRPTRLKDQETLQEHVNYTTHTLTPPRGDQQEIVWKQTSQQTDPAADSLTLLSPLTSEFYGEQFKPTNAYHNLSQPLIPGTGFGGMLHTSPSSSVDNPVLSNTASNLDMPLPEMLGCNPEANMTGLMRADLDHLYFDRVHRFVPFLNQNRYFTRAAQSTDTADAFTCLQHAMWMLAATTGSQFQEIQFTLYMQTRSKLEFLELEYLDESIPVDQVQAWILLTIFELTQGHSHRGWISAGRCFRLVHLLKLHEIDNPKNGPDSSHASLSWIELEERRRTLWTAYSLDRYLSLTSQLPMTFNEQSILTRLPAPEAAFQRQQVVHTDFLAQVINGNGCQPLSPFCESIIMLTLSGRCLSDQLLCNAEQVHHNISQNFLIRYQRLDGIVAQKMQAMSSRTAADGETSDPMYLFTDMVAQVTILLLSTTLESAQSDIYVSQEVINDHNVKAVLAAQRMSTLAQQLTQLGYLKVHPMTPILLYACAQFSLSRQNSDARYSAHLRTMTTALLNLGMVNNLAKVLLMKICPGGNSLSASGSPDYIQMSTVA